MIIISEESNESSVFFDDGLSVPRSKLTYMQCYSIIKT